MTNERRIYTADEARALREGRESTGAWDAGAGNIYAGHDTCPRHRGDAANQRIRCECRAVGAVDGDGDRALAAAAPDLAASVEHYAAIVVAATTAAGGEDRRERIFAKGLRHAARIASGCESVDDAVRAILADAAARDESGGEP